ncbi:class III lanthipeptide [Streptomyces flavofungini]|uniref:Class III lanthipeptide n=2 Tax=Streptomyces TaxID=1883 RepID=A0ABS0XII8_9ACTN|nr:class III lanthipeptide [Streptomyces flavofungini]MBJ3813008.1 class III lanthipeptide [Streptomyces flavofungini]
MLEVLELQELDEETGVDALLSTLSLTGCHPVTTISVGSCH